MKKHLLHFWTLALLVMFGGSAWAADPDLANDYTLVKSVTWGDGTNIAGSGSCAYTAYDTGNKKQQSLTILTAPEAAAGWVAMQAWTDGSGKGWWNRADKGLYCYNAGRSAAVFGDDLTTGWLVIFECSQSASAVMTLTNAAGEPDGTFSYTTSEDGKSYICTITAAEKAYVGFCGNKNAIGISKISVYKPNKAVIATTYTVNYVDTDGKSLKDPVVYDAIAGASISLSDADKANIAVGEDTYVYDSDDTEGKSVAEDGSSVINVKFHKAQNFNYTVNETCGSTVARETKSFSYETANVTVPYRKYNAVDGQLYKKDATSKEYNYRFQLTKDNQVEDLSYDKVENVTSVVYIAEGEDIEGLTPITTGNTSIRSSNSASAFATADTKITALPAGKYKIHAIIYDSASSPNSNWTFRAGAIDVATFNCTAVNLQEFDSEEFAIGKETDIIMTKAGGSARGLDALYIVKTGDVSDEEAAALIEAAKAAEALAAAKSALAASIEAAKTIETEGKNGAEELATAITTAETALATEDATVETLGAAKSALEQAISDFNEKNFDIATAIVNADFASMEGWTEYVSGGFKDYGNGLIGTYRVRTDDFIPAATVDETHLTTEYCIGLEARWEGNYASYNQNVTLPAGNYKLTFDVENVNAGTNNATYNNLFKVTVGETVYTDESTEWMKGKSAWTSHAIRFILAEEATVNISLGFGTGSNNFGHANTPALYVSHLALGTFDPMADSKEIALKAVDALPVGDGLFMYPEAAITTAKGAIESATTVDEVNAALATAKAAQSKPAADKAYAIANTTATGNLCITTEKVSVAKDASVFFTEVEGGYVLSNEAGEYILKTAGNTWTLSTTTTKEEAYVVNFNLADGAYTIQGANGLFGLDSTDEGSTVYANKAQSNNGLWTIAEYVAPVKTDYTDYIVNADLKGEGGFDAAGTKGFDGSGIVKASTQAEFDFKQTISIPSGYYRLTAQAAYRYGGDETAEAAAITEGTATKLVKMYVKIGEKEFSVPVQNRYDGASETNLANEGAVLVNDKYVPNSSSAVQAWFAAGKYVNEVIFNLPADGDVTIGINRIAKPESDYTVIGPWTLTRLGDAEVEPEPEPIEGIIYSWESPEGTPIETGGTIAYVNGDGDRLNYAQGGYYTICLNGKKANIDDETASANAGKMVITLDKAVAEGDTIAYTAFVNKNETKEASPYIVFENGTTAEGEIFGDEANIDATFNGVPTLKYTIVPAEAAGSKTITLTRSKTGTNLFIIKLQVIEKKAEPEPEPTPEPGTDMTAKIVNPSFETGNLDGWTVGNSSDTGVRENSNATYATEGCDGNYLFNTWWQGIPITQTVKDLSNGLYELKALMTNDAITAGNQPCLYLLANGGHSEAFSSENAGKFAEGSIQFYVLDGTATIGAVGGNADGSFNADGYYWYKVDNFRLTYLAPLPNIDDVVIPEGKMSVTAANAITTAKEAGDVIALMSAVENAKASIEAYAHMKKVLDDMTTIAEATNVYTAEAKNAYDEAVAAAQKGYDEGTVSDADAAAFNYGSRLDGTIPTLLLSAWTAKATGIPYINTWSVEGNNDGTNFFTPFFEYWVTDANSLAADTLTATLSGLEAGDYDVTAWVRVRAKNDYEAPATGITLQANDGEAIDVAAGDQVGTSQFYIKEFTATGTVAEDGVLKIKFNVAADNNISWLSFKNVKFEKHITVNPDDPEITVPEGKINLIANGNLAGDDVSSFFAKESPSADIVGARIVPGFGENNSRGIVVKSANEASNADAWNTQFWIKVNQPLESGTKLHVEFDYAASQAAKASTQAHGAPGAYQHWAAIGDVNFTTEWQHFSTDITVDETMAKGDKGEGIGMISIAFNLAEEKTATEYYFDNFGVWAELPAPVDEWTDLIVNGDMEGESLECFYVTEQGFGGPYVAMATEGIGKDGSKAVKVQSADSPAQAWDSQFFIRLPYQLPAGTKFKLSFDYKADKAGDFDTQAHAEPGQYIHWAMAGSGSFTTEWQTYEKEGTVPAECDGSESKNEAGEVLFLKTFQTIAFNLAKNNVATEFIFDNIKFEIPADVAKTLTPNPAVNPVYYKDVLALGIENVKVAQKADVIYNLRGQKVNKAEKGLFIINGKKVVK